MQRSVAFALFVAVVLAMTAGAHLYLWTRLVRDVQPPPLGYRVATGALVALFCSVPLAFYLGRTLPPDRGALLVPALSLWLGVLFLLLLLCVAADLAQLVVRAAQLLGGNRPPVDPERRLALARLVGGGIAVLAGGATTAGLAAALAPVTVREVRVALQRLAPPLAGTTIVQLSDLHIGPSLRRSFVEAVVAQTNALRPDVIVITGDLVDGSVARLRSLVAPLAALRARYGVYFVTGNHEYYSNAPQWCAELERLGLRVLRNERVQLGTDEAALDLAGVDDYKAHEFGHGHGADLSRALAARDTTRPVVLLAHQPLAVHEAATHAVDLVLSGHTHGGQIWPWHYFVRLQQPAVHGLYRFGATQLYVSAGTGYWGPPLRLFAPAEITRIVLTPA